MKTCTIKRTSRDRFIVLTADGKYHPVRVTQEEAEAWAQENGYTIT